jgi:hypothetical protein
MIGRVTTLLVLSALDPYGTWADEGRTLIRGVWTAVTGSPSGYSMTSCERLIHFIGVPHIPCLKKRSPLWINPTLR